LLADLARDLGDRDDRRAGALGDRDGVAEVVAVAVGEQDRVGGDLVGRGGRLRVAGQERIDEHGRAVVLKREGRVTEEADVHQRSSPVSLVRMSSWASSRPTATPTSIPRRVSSATSVRIIRSRSSGSSSDAAWLSCASWAPLNQPPSARASLRTCWSPGAAWVTISWAWAKRSGSARAATAASTSSALY